MSIPIIAVLPLYDTTKDTSHILHIYTDCIHNAGGLPLVLSVTMSKEDIEKTDKSVDGYLFTGGPDINPAFYGEENIYCGNLCPERDNIEKAVFDVAYSSGKPILGICRGYQLINAMLGGTLYQDLPAMLSDEITHTDGPFPKMAKHRAYVIENTPLYEMGGSEIIVNSYHHQGIKTLANGLVPMCKSPDGLIEAYYAPDKKFLMGFQSHPERTFTEDNWSKQVWQMFINAAEKEIHK